MSEPTLPIKSSASSEGESSTSLRVPLSLVRELPSQAWRERLKRLAKPRVLISAFLAASAFYCFVVGRDRYTATSEFVIQQAMPLDGGSASMLSGTATAPNVLISLLDGQYLQVYLESFEVKNRLFPDRKKFEQDYKPTFPDFRTGLPANSSAPANSAFIENIVCCSQPLTGTVVLRTTVYHERH